MKTFRIAFFFSLLLSDSALTAQRDTVFMAPKILLSFDSSKYTRKEFERNGGDYGNIVGESQFYKVIEDYKYENLEVLLSFMTDTIVSIDHIKWAYIRSQKQSDNTFIADSIFFSPFYLYLIQFVPNECDANGVRVKGKYSVHGFADLGENFIAEIKYNPGEGENKQTRWNPAREIISGMTILTLSEADERENLPYTPAHVEALIEDARKKAFESGYEWYIQRLRCSDNEYLADNLKRNHRRSYIDSLVMAHNDTMLAILTGENASENIEFSYSWRIRDMLSSHYTYSESYNLLNRLRDESIPLTDHFKFRNDSTSQGVLRRLDELIGLDYDDITIYKNDPGNVYQDRFRKALNHELFRDSIEITDVYEEPYKTYQLLIINGRSIRNEVSCDFIVKVFPALNGNYRTSIVPLPETAEYYSDVRWQLAYEEQDLYTILINEEDNVLWILADGGSASDRVSIPIISFDNTRAMLASSGELSNIYQVNKDEPYFGSHRMDKKTRERFHNALIASEHFTKSDEERSPQLYFKDDETARKAYWQVMENHPYLSGEDLLPIHINDSAQCDMDVYLELLSEFLAPGDKALFSELYVNDLDGNGTLDIYRYIVSNGKLEHFEFWTKRNGHLISDHSGSVKKMIMATHDFQNQKYYSQMGNFLSDEEYIRRSLQSKRNREIMTW